ncbi:MAG: AraC family transcriptional regulator [Acidobacteriota bacterium]
MLSKTEHPNTVSRCWFTPDFQFGLHYFRYVANDFRCLPHTHGEHNFIVCLEHSYQCVVNGKEETMEPGDLLVINPGDVHKSRYNSDQVPSEGVTLYLTQRALESILCRMHIPFDGRRQSIRFLGKVRDPKVLELVQELLTEWQGQKEGYDVVMQSCMLQILVHLIRSRLEPTIVEKRFDLPRQLPSWQMDWAIEYMNARGKSNFSLSELCSRLGISQPHFIKLFKNSTGTMIPHDYYNRLLIDRAQRLLQSPDCSVKEVAFELGFKSDSHFCSLFRSFTGMTPKSYQSHLDGDS